MLVLLERKSFSFYFLGTVFSYRSVFSSLIASHATFAGNSVPLN